MREVRIHSVNQSYVMRASLVFFNNIYVSDTELLEKFTFQIICRRKTIILLLE